MSAPARHTIRGRLTRSLLFAIVPLVVVVGLGLFMFVRAALTARFDDALLARARGLAGLVKFDAGKVEFDFAGESMPEYDKHNSGDYFELWQLDSGQANHLIERSGSLAGARLAQPSDASTLSMWDDSLPDGSIGRLASLRFTPYPDRDKEGEPRAETPPDSTVPKLFLITAQNRSGLHHTLELFAWSLFGAGLILVGGALIIVRLALIRGLSPITALAAQVEAIGPHDLSQRIDHHELPRELTPVGEKTNKLLERVAAAFEREKRLAASAAHELRTPLAEVRAVTELALSRDRATDEYRRALESVLDSAQRMGDSADAILRLARVQSGREQVVLEQVNLLDALRPAWLRAIEPLVARGIRAALDVPPGVLVRADAAMLGVIFDNLCANAAKHTPANGNIRAQLNYPASSAVDLVIENTVQKVQDDQAAQTRDGKPIHAGLGLVIANAMSACIGAALDARPLADQFVVTLRIPLAQHGPPATARTDRAPQYSEGTA